MSELATLLREIIDVESVSGNERELADIVAARLADAPHLTLDRDGDCVVARTNLGRAERVVIAGHLDTVFPEGTNVAVKKEGTKMTAPGIGDDCRGLATILAVARAMQDAISTNRGDWRAHVALSASF